MIAKRVFDLFFTVLGMILLLPVYMFVALWIKIDSSGPVFFRQERIGKNGVPFQIFKFRTMVVDAESRGTRLTVANDSRITKCGAFLRKFKLDELAQLINVLKGEMSLVGPRPEVPEYVAYWPSNLRTLILSVPPGITDLASIEFRNESELLAGDLDPVGKYIQVIMPIKLEYYEKYVRERSIFFDIWIILRTMAIVFK